MCLPSFRLAAISHDKDLVAWMPMPSNAVCEINNYLEISYTSN